MKIHLLLLAIPLFLSIAACTRMNGDEEHSAGPKHGLLLTGSNAPHVTIVVAPGSSQTAIEAAKELQRLTEKATGTRWEITDTLSEDGANIVVGPHPAAEAAGILANDLPPEGFRIRAMENTVFIVGRDTPGDPWDMHWMRANQTGTLFGVIEFTRRFYNARWLLPGPTGETLNHVEQLIIPKNFDVSDHPHFSSRKIITGFDCQSPKDRARFLRMNRLGWSHVSCYWHNWYQTISPEVYAAEHPDWFALVNGSRATHLRNGSYDGQLCVTNPEVIAKMAEIAVAQFKEIPKWTMFSLSENDGANHCQCERCRAKDSEEWAPGIPSISDRLAEFANAIRTTIGDRAPGLNLGYYAYHHGELPPVHTRLLPDIWVSDVCNGYDVHFHQPKMRQRRHDTMKKWRELAENVEMVSYFHGMSWWNLPTFSPEAIADLIRTAAKFPSSKGFWIAFPDGAFGAFGNEVFLSAELLWNPDADVNHVLNEFYTSAFGPAAKPIQAYFETIRQSFAKSAAAVPVVPDEMRPGDDWILTTYDPIRKDADKLIAQALKSIEKTDDTNLRNRVGYVANAWEWTKIQTDTLQAIKNYQTKPSKEAAKVVMNVLTIRETFLEEHSHQGDYSINWKDVAATDQQRALPVKRAEYEMAFLGKTKSVQLSLNPQSTPVRLEFVENRTGDKPMEPTCAEIHTGENAITIHFKANDTNVNRLREDITDRDGEVWKDDVVEIFLTPRRASKQTYHLLINPAGALLDLVYNSDSKTDPSWDSQATVSTQKTLTGWEANIRIPYTSLGLKEPPKPGDVWAVNLTRSRRSKSPEEDSAWSPTFGLFHRPERFGEFIFAQ